MRWVALSLLVASASGAQTRLSVAPGSSCDESLRRELARLAGIQLVESEAEVKASLDAKPPGWRLRVERAGAETLERALDARDCAEAAFAASVVVERYLHQLPSPTGEGAAKRRVRGERTASGTDKPRAEKPSTETAGTNATPSPGLRPPSPVGEGPPPTPPVPPPPPAEATPAPAPAPAEPAPPPPARVEPNQVVVSAEPEPAAPAPAPTPPAATQPAPAPAAPSEPFLRLTRWELALNGAGWIPAPSGTRFGFGVEAGLLFSPGWRASLELAGSLPEETVIIINGETRGTLSVMSFNAILTAGRCIDRELRPCLALAGGVRLGRGATSGDYLFHKAPSWQVRPSFGLALQLHYLPWKWLFAGFELLGLVNPVPAQFEIQGVPTATTAFPTFEGLLRVSFGATFNR